MPEYNFQSVHLPENEVLRAVACNNDMLDGEKHTAEYYAHQPGPRDWKNTCEFYAVNSDGRQTCVKDDDTECTHYKCAGHMLYGSVTIAIPGQHITLDYKSLANLMRRIPGFIYDMEHGQRPLRARNNGKRVIVNNSTGD